VKFRWPLLFFFVFLFTSCVLEKRHYRNGFYVNWNKNSVHEQVSDTLVLESPVHIDNEHNSVDLVTDENVIVEEENIDVVPTNGESKETRPESTDHSGELNDDPKPEGHDKINPIISPMVGFAFAIPLSLVVLELIGNFGSNPYVLLIGIPLIAALLFALAMNLRRKYVMLNALGDKRTVIRLSAHFHRFQILLYIYFAAALMLSLGFALGLSTSGILGWIGIILSGGGIVVGLGVAAILLALFAFYLIRWRKDPTGYKPPRNPHPPKDR
jgi:hypothetical protein